MAVADLKILIEEGLKGTSNVVTANTLGYVKAGFEAFKNWEIPRVSPDGQLCYGISYPYKESKDIQRLVDFMIIFLDESIKQLQKEVIEKKGE